MTNPTNYLNMARIFRAPRTAVFQAIAEGMLFRSTDPIDDSLSLDFQVGGKYRLKWSDSPDYTEGEFLEIEPHERIVFSWKSPTIDTKVTLVLTEADGYTTMSLKHEGFTNIDQTADHNEGWNDAVNKMRDLFSEASKALALDISFKTRRRIRTSVGKAFNTVMDPDELYKVLTPKASGPLTQGSEVVWKFENYRPLTLHVHQVIENELIKFKWDDAHVCFTFRPINENETEVCIHVTNTKDSQEALTDTFSECQGWEDMIVHMKLYLERGYTYQDLHG